MAKSTRKRFRKQLLVFTIVLLIISIAILIYVHSSLVSYEKNIIDNYMSDLITDIKKAATKGNIDKYISLAKGHEKEQKEDAKKAFKNAKKITYQKNKEDNTYNIIIDGNKYAEIKLDDSKKVNTLGLLNYTVWDIEKITLNTTIDFYLTSDLTLKVNGKKVDSKYLKDEEIIKGYEDFKDISDVVSLNHYHIDDLLVRPSLEVVDDDDNKIDYVMKEGKYYIDYFKTDDEKEAMNHLVASFDSIGFAKMWSKFLTNDLSGTYHGINQLKPYLVEGTDMYKKAYNWAHGVDITFTSIHTLDSFTNEKVSNFTIYNKYAFSVEVYLEKNMTLNRSGKRVDKMHDILYFVYYDGEFRLSKLQSIMEE